MRKHQYKKGFEYSVGDTLEYGTILGIWPHPKQGDKRILFVENTDKYHGTYTFYTMDNKHYVGPTLNRFVPHAIVMEAYSLLSGVQLPAVDVKNEDVPHPTNIPNLPKQTYKIDLPDNAEEMVKSSPVNKRAKETKEPAASPKPPPIKKKRYIPPLGSMTIKRKDRDG